MMKRQELPRGVKHVRHPKPTNPNALLDKDGNPVPITICNTRVAKGSRTWRNKPRQLDRKTLTAQQRLGK